MHIRNSIICLLTLSCLLPQAGSPQDADVSVSESKVASANFRQETLVVNVGGTNINTYFFIPKGIGKFPLLIMSHGCPRSEKDRIKIGPHNLIKQAEAYATTGVAVALPIRRGYGGQGQWAEGYGGHDRADYYHAGLAGAEDINAVIAASSQLSEIDTSRIVVMGVSAGGWASIAAAARNPQILGVVNFAGGRGSVESDHVCHEENLIHAAQLYGETTRAPELWIYSQNDHFFNQPLAQRMCNAFNSAGGRAAFISAPPYEDEGHHYVKAIFSWKPEVDDFLRQIGFLNNQN